MNDDQPGGWKRLPKMNFDTKHLSKRMKKVEGATVRHARKFVFRRWNNIREVRRHIAIWVLMVGYILAASALQLSWYQQGYRVATAASDGTYAEGVVGPLETLDPLFANSSAEQSAGNLIFSRLMTYDTTGHLNYDLATNMTVDETKKVYTVTLRSDAEWHDGRQLTAKDVAFTIGLIQNPSVRSTITGWDNIAVAALDDQTVTFTLPSVYAAFPHALNFPVLPEHILGDIDPNTLRENGFSTNPVGSGPFKFRLLQDVDTISSRKVVHMIRNDDYYKGAPKLERFQLGVYTNHTDVLKALSTSEVNGAVDLSVTDLAQVNTTRYDTTKKPINAGVYAIFNTTSPALSDKAVRQAIQKGTDTKAVREALGEDIPALYLPFVNGQLSGDVPAEPTYDLEAAKKQLNDAGWVLDGSVRKKGDTVLQMNVVTVKNNDFEKVLEKLSGQWRLLGITVNTTIVDPTDVADKVVETVLRPRSYDVLLYQLTIGGDPDVYAYWHSSQASPNEKGRNFANYSNVLADDTLTSASSRTETDLRNAKYLTFARQWLTDAPAIGLYQSTLQYVSSKNISTVGTSDTLISPVDRYSNLLYWSVNQKTVYTTP